MVVVSPSFSEPVEGIIMQSPSTKLLVNDQELGTATLYITEHDVVWGGGVGSNGGPSPTISLLYPNISLHAIQREPSPALYMVLNYELRLPELTAQSGDGGDDDEDFDVDDQPITQLRFVPQDEGDLQQLYSAMSQGQSLHPDPTDEVDDDPYLDGEDFNEGGVDAPEFGEPLTNLTVPIGRDATFKCIVVNLGNYRVGWVKADTKAIQAIHEHVITHNHRVSVSHSDHFTWYLHIKNVQEEDRGQYMCQINTDPMKSQMGFLEVVIPPDFIPEETSGDTMVPEGGTARVSCKARGIPPPRVMWKREDGQEIVVRDQNGSKTKVLSFQGEVLKLSKISRSEMGTYLCIASNGVPPTVSKRIHISVHFHPVIQVPNQLVGAPLGTDVTLECYVESSPKSINYWVKDPGELIIPSEHHEMTVRQKSMFEAEMSMTIKNIRREDLGSYICVAKNSLGDVESKIRLYEIPGNDRHVYQYPDERTTSDDEYGTEIYDDEDISNNNDNVKSNRVPDRANKWYSNDGKIVITTPNGASTTLTATLTLSMVFLLPTFI